MSLWGSFGVIAASFTCNSLSLAICLILAMGLVVSLSWIENRIQWKTFVQVLVPAFLLIWTIASLGSFALKDGYAYPRSELKTLLSTQARLKSNRQEFLSQLTSYTRARSRGDLAHAKQPHRGVRIRNGHMSLEQVISWKEADSLWKRAENNYLPLVEKQTQENEPTLSRYAAQGIPWWSAFPATWLDSLMETVLLWSYFLLIQIGTVQTRELSRQVATSLGGTQGRSAK